MAGSCCVWCTRIITVIIALIAIFIGWCRTDDFPESKIFANIIPVMKGYPPPFLGPWKEPGTPAVPEDMKPEPRPSGLSFLPLPGGSKMPQVGLGTCCRPTAYDDETIRRSVLWYLLLGGRHIDTADYYRNHKPIGRAIQEAIDRGIPRSEIFVTTKIPPRFFGKGSGVRKVKQYLEELDLDYLDLVIMHAPSQIPLLKSGCDKEFSSFKECRLETWRSLSEARSAGLVREIGVSNFSVRQMSEIQKLVKEEGAAPIAANQINFNPWVDDWLHDAFEYCQKNGIVVMAWASLAGSFMQTDMTLKVETLQRIANAHDTTVFQVLLRWAVQKGAAIIPGTGNPKHMKENLSLYEFKLTKEEMSSIDALRSDESANKFMSLPEDTES